MNGADWVIIAILGLSIAISCVRGFVREAMSLVVWAAAFIIAMLFHDNLAVYFTELIATPSLRFIVAWVVLFFTVLIAGSILNYLLSKLVESTGLSGTDRLLGMIFGALRGFIIIMVVLIMLPGILPINQDLWWQDSSLIPHFLRFEGWARELASQFMEFVKSFY